MDPIVIDKNKLIAALTAIASFLKVIADAETETETNPGLTVKELLKKFTYNFELEKVADAIKNLD